MKKQILTLVILIGIGNIGLSKELSVLVTKEKMKNAEKSALEQNLPDEKFRIKVIEPKSATPDLIIPTYSSVRIRIADTSISLNRVEIAIQIDEFRIEYSDYRLLNGKWDLKVRKSVCELSGSLAMALAQVEIHEGGIVEVKYHEVISNKRVLSWDNELIQKNHNDNDKLLSERYILKDGEFQLIGKSVRLRPKK